MIRSFRLPVALFGLWLLLSGYFVALILGLGILSCLLVWYVSARMDKADGAGHHGEVRPVAAIRYLGWLTIEIVKSNIDVARRVLSPDLPIRPTIIRVPASQSTDLGRVIHANSITLTPGTVSIEIGDVEIEVHALSRAAAETLAEGEMDKRVSSMEKGI